MNDPHVVALFYNIKHKKSVDYSKAEPLEREKEDFTIKIENDKACFTMKAHYATEEEARKAVEEYIQVWELDAALQEGPNAFTLEFSCPKIEDRNPLPVRRAPGDIEATYAYSPQPRMEGKLCVTHLYSSYPPPPSGMKITPDVRSMYDRLMGHLSDKEPLASMAYFCLTVLEASTGDRCKKAKDAEHKRSKGEMYGVELASVVCPRVVPSRRATAAEMYRIELAVLKKTGHLSSVKGARKASGQETLKDPEDRFLKEAIKALIHRAAEVAYGPVSRLPEIKLTDLLKC